MADAELIAAAWWAVDRHRCAAELWTSYAATLPPSPAIAQATTGMQSATFSPPMPGGELGAALARAAWHRTFCPTLVSVPLRTLRTGRPCRPPRHRAQSQSG